ncbi:MAG: hypothetical protein ACK5HU_01575, partial [Flavobacteriales bacterium]
MLPVVKNTIIALIFSLGIGALFLFVNNLSLSTSFLTYFLFWLVIAACFAIPSFFLAKLLDIFFPWETSKNRLLLTIIANVIVLLFLSIMMSYMEHAINLNNSISIVDYIESTIGKRKVLNYFIIALLFSFFFHAKGFYEALVESKERVFLLINDLKEIEL